MGRWFLGFLSGLVFMGCQLIGEFAIAWSVWAVSLAIATGWSIYVNTAHKNSEG